MAAERVSDTEADQVSRGVRRALAIVSVALNLALAAMFVFDLVRAHENPMDYPFGAQNSGWTYRSLENYLIFGAAVLTVLAAAIVAALVVRSYLLRVVLGFAPVPLLLLANTMLGAE